ncbi:helix-turn-helix domain-containing protein [Sphingomonas sp.]|uniref:helix-turn-helix domain-containing protein n=1 Tax=Sphingomonas sp. TaxID=28214 RepID=UPI003F7F09C7
MGVRAMTSQMPGDAAAEDDPSNTSVRIYLPDERLRSFATFYYFVETDGPLEDFLYPEWGNALFATRGEWRAQLGRRYPDEPLIATLFGPTDRAAQVFSPGGKTMGFGLTPLGWQRFLGIPADELANRIVPLGDHFGVPASALFAQLDREDDDLAGVAMFDALLLDRLAATDANPAWAIELDTVLRDRPHNVEQFAATVGVSDRVLARRCKKLFGFSPKRLLRRQRFLDTLGRMRVMEQRHYNSLLDPEYFDQAHFVHEFREFMGLSPTQFLAVPRPLMG